jgi:hypothetical protein
MQTLAVVQHTNGMGVCLSLALQQGPDAAQTHVLKRVRLLRLEGRCVNMGMASVVG